VWKVFKISSCDDIFKGLIICAYRYAKPSKTLPSLPVLEEEEKVVIGEDIADHIAMKFPAAKLKPFKGNHQQESRNSKLRRER